jgi:gas vesicle protein
MPRITMLALAAGLLAAPFATGEAQTETRDTSRAKARVHAENPHREMGRMRMAPIQRVIAQRERLKLTEEQVNRLTAIQSKLADANKPHLETLKAARSDTTARPRPEARTERTPMTPEQRLERRQQMLDRQKAFLAAHPEVSRAHTAIAENHRKAQDEVNAVLTDEQEKLLEQRMDRQRRPMRRGTPDSVQRRPARG